MKCKCGLKFKMNPPGIVQYEEHLPCPADEARFQQTGLGREV